MGGALHIDGQHCVRLQVFILASIDVVLGLTVLVFLLLLLLFGFGSAVLEPVLLLLLSAAACVH